MGEDEKLFGAAEYGWMWLDMLGGAACSVKGEGKDVGLASFVVVCLFLMEAS